MKHNLEFYNKAIELYYTRFDVTGMSDYEKYMYRCGRYFDELDNIGMWTDYERALYGKRAQKYYETYRAYKDAKHKLEELYEGWRILINE